MNETFTPELLTQARTAESPEALAALAAENGVTLTPEEAQAHFDLLHQTGELSDEELDNVAGGKGCYNGGKMVVTAHNTCARTEYWACKKCGGPAYSEVYTNNNGYNVRKVTHTCNGIEGSAITNCMYCKHCTYERGLLLCNNPEAYR